MPVQSPGSFVHPTTHIALVTTRVGEMFCLHMVQHILPAMVDKLVAEATLVLPTKGDNMDTEGVVSPCISNISSLYTILKITKT
jgi:hypothetical protein